MSEKVCCICHKILPIAAFGNDKHSKDKRTSACKLCRNARTRQWVKDNPERVKELNDSNKGKRKDYYSSSSIKKPHHKNLELLRGFGITLDDYNRMLDEQGGGCAICHNPESVKRNKYLSVDHSHDTGKIRGLLCDRCNRGIGLLKEDPLRLRAAAEYIEKGTQ